MQVLSYFRDIQFAEKQWFWLFLVIPMMIAWYVYKLKTYEGELNYSSFHLLSGIKSSLKPKFRHSSFILRLICISLLILAIARPQSRSSWKDTKTEGIDIVVSLDVSLSMLAKDFKPNRIEVAKEVLADFIDARPNDKIGLVIFGGEAFTQCPLTTDHKIIKNMFGDIKAGMLDQGTAIGLGLADGVARVKDSKAKSKVVILISDGVSNVGEIAPLTAAEIAKTFGVRVYCIGVGSKGKALQPVALYPNGEMEYDYVDVDIDDATMTQISKMTGGKYFRATDRESLEKTYKEIDLLEKTIISEKSFTNKAEHFLPLALAAAVCLLLEFVLKRFVFNAIP
ncbi:MAG: von Willebrand factor type domain protein [Bacteroidota bacterium]|jgi:Ca-activated chloride channel family protein|nr:von Willebrand factor type domain protein [Bacteroidota bacterium]